MVPVDDILFEIRASASPSTGSAREATTRKRPKKKSTPLHANNIVSGDTASTPTRSVSVEKAKPRKRAKKKLWSYEIVAEPTGVASKYWQGEVPSLRGARAAAQLRMEASKQKEDEERLQNKNGEEKESSDDDDVPIAQTIREEEADAEEEDDAEEISAAEEEADAEDDTDSDDSKPRRKKSHQRTAKLENLDVSSTCVAGKELATMSDAAKEVISIVLNKRLKKVKNKEVTSCILQEKYKALVEEHAAALLKNNTQPVTKMVHARRQTLGELTTVLNRVKVGDWVEVECDYSSTHCSAGGIGCVVNVMEVGSDTVSTGEDSYTTFVDVHYLITNTKEKKIGLDRLTVIPMPFRGNKSTLRKRTADVTSVKASQPLQSVRGYETLTPIGK